MSAMLSDFAYSIIKDLIAAKSSANREIDLKIYVAQLASEEARYNLDLLDIILRNLDEDHRDERIKACGCLRCQVPELFSATGILPKDIFGGEAKFLRKAEAKTAFGDDEEDTISFRDGLSEQGFLYLYYYNYRKIEILRSLGAAKADPCRVLSLKARGENLKTALIGFLKKLDSWEEEGRPS